MFQITKRLFFSLSATLSLSCSIFFKKQALLTGIPPIELLVKFIFISAIVLTVSFFLFQNRYVKETRKINLSEIKYALLAGLFLLTAYILTTLGLQLSTSINYSLITRSTLIFTIILAYFLLKEKMTTKKLLLVFCFFMGIYFITTGGTVITPRIGDLTILIGAFFFSYFYVIQKILNKNLPPEMISWIVSSISAILAIFAGFLIKINFFSTNSLIFILLIGLFEALFILFMNKALRVTNITYFIMMNMLIPVINGFLGYCFLNESLNLIQLLGGFILIMSSILVQQLRT